MVIPIRDENPTRRFPVVTVALIEINHVVIIAIQLPRANETSDIVTSGGFTEQDEFNYEYAAIPCELVEGHPLDIPQFVVQDCSATAATIREPGSDIEVFPDKNVYLAVLFSMFMHGSILHVLGNMLFLWIFGNNVEDRFGPIPYLVFYLFCGVVATAAHVAFNTGSTVPTIGASGAIAGVMGAYIVWWPHARVLSIIPILFFFGFIELPAGVVLGIWFIMQFFTNPNEGVAWLAHVGGFAAGAALALLLRNVLPPSPLGPPRPRPRWGRQYGGRDDGDWDPGFGGGYRGRP
jgi:membrane associated rhomboid family serine protease